MFLEFPKKIPCVRCPTPRQAALFASDPGLVPIPKKPDLWYLDGPMVFVQPGLTITIPAGFITDDASVPKFLDWIPFLDRQGLSRRPGALHDGLYSLGRSKGKDWCDHMLAVACEEDGMKEWQAEAYYQGVHLFGQSSWDADAREGTFGEVTSGDFITQAAFDAWVKAGATIFK